MKLLFSFFLIALTFSSFACNSTVNINEDSYGNIYGGGTGSGYGEFFNWYVYDDQGTLLYNFYNTSLVYYPGANGNYTVSVVTYDSNQVICDSSSYPLITTNYTGVQCNITANVSINSNNNIEGNSFGGTSYIWRVYDSQGTQIHTLFGSSTLLYTPSQNGNYQVCVRGFNQQAYCDSMCFDINYSGATGGSSCGITSGVSSNSLGVISGNSQGAASVLWTIFDDNNQLIHTSSNANGNFNFDPGYNGNFNVCFVGYDNMQTPCDSACYALSVTDTTSQSNCSLVSNATSDSSGNIVGAASGAFVYEWGVFDANWNLLSNYTGNNLSFTPPGDGYYNVCLVAYDTASNICDSNCYSIPVWTDTGANCSYVWNTYSDANGTIYGQAVGNVNFDWRLYDSNNILLTFQAASNFVWNPNALGTFTLCLGTSYSGIYCDSLCNDFTFTDTTSTNGCNPVSNVTYDGNGNIVGAATGANAYTWDVYDDAWNILYTTNNNVFQYPSGTTGTYNVCISSFDSTQVLCDSTCYSLNIDSLASVIEPNAIEFSIYPNPTKGIVNLVMSPDQIDAVLLTDIAGAVLTRKSIQETLEQIDLSQYPEGLYLIHLIGNEGERISTQKIIHQ